MKPKLVIGNIIGIIGLILLILIAYVCLGNSNLNKVSTGSALLLCIIGAVVVKRFKRDKQRM